MALLKRYGGLEDPMSMREQLEKDCKLCPSDLKQSGDPWDKTLARMTTYGRSQTPSHSMNERHWNNVNLLDIFLIGMKIFLIGIEV